LHEPNRSRCGKIQSYFTVIKSRQRVSNEPVVEGATKNWSNCKIVTTSDERYRYYDRLNLQTHDKYTQNVKVFDKSKREELAQCVMTRLRRPEASSRFSFFGKRATKRLFRVQRL
jgi:hypothetical protein